jgi:hypothetical protein
LENPGTFGNPIRIFGTLGQSFLKAITLGLSQENQDEWDLCRADDIIAAYQPIMLLGPVIKIPSFV